MDVLILLSEARFAGLRVTASGNQLVVQGPRRLEPMARLLLAEKPTILRALAEEQEVAWRIDAMRPHVPATGAIPLLLARPDAMRCAGLCCSCGDPVGPAEGYRCAPCVAAAVALLGTVE
ncbi:MAG: hypothetical protein ACLQBX_01965 [Candidatus Limnocylindrales bacterium]